MKYMLMGLETRGEWERLPQAERDVRVGRHRQALQELVVQSDLTGNGNLLLASVGLGAVEEASTVRFERGTSVVIDGPFAETKEVLAGFDIIDFDSREQAVEFCKKRCTHDGHVSEIRPVHQFRWAYHGAGRGDVTKFALLIVADESVLSKLSETEIEQGAAHHGEAAMEYATGRGFLREESLSWCGVRLRRTPQASTLRRVGGQALLADGPFAETKEVLGGVCVIDCASKQEAIHWAQKLAYPGRDMIEVRPVRSMWWIYYG